MVTVHQMPAKNQFLTGISSGYDKISYQDEPKLNTRLGFTGDWPFDLLGKESCHRMTSTFTGTGILNNTSIKPDTVMIPFDGYFESLRFEFEFETSKSDNFMMIFTSYRAF